MSAEKTWTVTARLEVVAPDQRAAEDRVADALRAGFKGSGIGPVGTFTVRAGAPMLDNARAAGAD